MPGLEPHTHAKGPTSRATGRKINIVRRPFQDWLNFQGDHCPVLDVTSNHPPDNASLESRFQAAHTQEA